MTLETLVGALRSSQSVQEQEHEGKTEKSLASLVCQPQEPEPKMEGSTAVRERPLLMSGTMVRAILDGTKTQTRRVVKLRRPDDELTPDHGVKRWLRHITQWWVARSGHYPCPYGQPGDRLWVRENIRFVDGLSQYAADGSPLLWFGDAREAVDWVIDQNVKGKTLVPSIHMPRWASRLRLELTGVRVERVQDISEEDARAEGVDEYSALKFGAPSAAYRQLWDSLNAKRGYGWDVNPFVWVLEFRRVEP